MFPEQILRERPDTAYHYNDASSARRYPGKFMQWARYSRVVIVFMAVEILRLDVESMRKP